jgi:hypothetical protein
LKAAEDCGNRVTTVSKSSEDEGGVAASTTFVKMNEKIIALSECFSHIHKNAFRTYQDECPNRVLRHAVKTPYAHVLRKY